MWTYDRYYRRWVWVEDRAYEVIPVERIERVEVERVEVRRRHHHRRRHIHIYYN